MSEITKVKVLNADFETVKELSTPEELKEFRRLWYLKTRVPEGSPIWPFKLDIKNGVSSDRWLYDGNGLAVRLGKQAQPFYRIDDKTAFNGLIGAVSGPNSD